MAVTLFSNPTEFSNIYIRSSESSANGVNVRPAVQLSEHQEDACRLGCEGIGSMRRGTRYQSGRSVH